MDTPANSLSLAKSTRARICVLSTAFILVAMSVTHAQEPAQATATPSANADEVKQDPLPTTVGDTVYLKTNKLTTVSKDGSERTHELEPSAEQRGFVVTDIMPGSLRIHGDINGVEITAWANEGQFRPSKRNMPFTKEELTAQEQRKAEVVRKNKIAENLLSNKILDVENSDLGQAVLRDLQSLAINAQAHALASGRFWTTVDEQQLQESLDSIKTLNFVVLAWRQMKSEEKRILIEGEIFDDTLRDALLQESPLDPEHQTTDSSETPEHEAK